MIQVDGYLYKFIEVGHDRPKIMYKNGEYYVFTGKISEVKRGKQLMGWETEFRPIQMKWERFMLDLKRAAKQHHEMLEEHRQLAAYLNEQEGRIY